MAKKSGGANKSELIRLAMEQGIDSPRDISAHLKSEHGVEATPAYVSTIKSNMRRKKTGKAGKPGRRPGASPKVRKNAATLGDVSLSSGIDFVRSVGGIENARRTLDLLDEIKRM